MVDEAKKDKREQVSEGLFSSRGPATENEEIVCGNKGNEGRELICIELHSCSQAHNSVINIPRQVRLELHLSTLRDTIM
jgi:hypothetical protein